MKTIKQIVGFGIVGFFGTLVNGIVFSVLSQIPALAAIPIQWFVLGSISWAWGIGILAGFIFNFVFDKWLVFKA